MRYTDLAETLVKKITEGHVAIGEQLPSEAALAQQFKVSRSTIRSALNIVEDLGLVTRKRRVGTVVTSNVTTSHYSKSVHSIEDLVSYASHTVRLIIKVKNIVADEDLAKAIECKPGQKWVLLEMLRAEKNAEQSPICMTHAYLDPKLGKKIVPLIKDGSGLISHIIETQTGRSVSDIKQSIGAISIPAIMSKALRTKTSAPALEITRQYLDKANKAFLVTVSVYPADKFKFVLWLHRNTT